MSNPEEISTVMSKEHPIVKAWETLSPGCSENESFMTILRQFYQDRERGFRAMTEKDAKDFYEKGLC